MANPAQAQQFVTRSGERLFAGRSPFYFLGVNAYYLPFIASYGETAAVESVLESARSLGLTALRTWAFFDSPDTSDPGVIQIHPGTYNERGLRGLDFVVASAKEKGIRLVLPLVNSWDDYGGMNQYVRWRVEERVLPSGGSARTYSDQELQGVIDNGEGERYRIALSETAGHDHFYTDPVIREWFKAYVSMLLGRVNTITGIAYRDEPAILAWELANEPRSSDRTGIVVNRWLDEMSRFLKSIDPYHLVGSGEEGFETSPRGYARDAYNRQDWLFDGTGGVSFSLNAALPQLDFASIHLYPDSWNLPVSAGNTWIRDHLRASGALSKPLLLGEFGIRTEKAQTLESWLTTALLDGVAGSLVWQLLDGSRGDAEGFGFQCPGPDPVCLVLRTLAGQFNEKSKAGKLSPPSAVQLHQNYPNPFNARTIISYELPYDAHVRLEVFSLNGSRVLAVVDDIQRSGVRKELVDGLTLPSGAYFYRLTVSGMRGEGFMETKRFLLIK